MSNWSIEHVHLCDRCYPETHLAERVTFATNCSSLCAWRWALAGWAGVKEVCTGHWYSIVERKDVTGETILA